MFMQYGNDRCLYVFPCTVEIDVVRHLATTPTNSPMRLMMAREGRLRRVGGYLARHHCHADLTDSYTYRSFKALAVGAESAMVVFCVCARARARVCVCVCGGGFGCLGNSE